MGAIILLPHQRSLIENHWTIAIISLIELKNSDSEIVILNCSCFFDDGLFT